MKGDLLPGRELDVLVAEQVMGWVKIQESRTSVDIVGIALGSHKLSSLPYYSTSIEAAWQVVERVTESCKFNLSMGMFGLYWNAAFYIGTPFETVTAATAPHAICLAALKTMEAR